MFSPRWPLALPVLIGRALPARDEVLWIIPLEFRGITGIYRVFLGFSLAVERCEAPCNLGRFRGLILVMRFLTIATLLMICLLPLGVVFAQVGEDGASNTYTFLGEDEDLQLSAVPGNILLGYVNTHGVGETDRHLLLAMFFQKGTIEGDQLYFITKPVHGLRYEFKRKLSRGVAKSPAEEGYFQIVGTLTQYLADAEGKVDSHSRDVTFKSMPFESPEPAEHVPAKRSSLQNIGL